MKEVDDMTTRYEIDKEKISKEEYFKLIAQGKTDKQIISELDIRQDIFYRIKKEWGLVGKGKVVPPDNMSPVSTDQVEPSPAVKVVTEEPEVEWAVPFKPIDKKPVVRVSDKGISINSYALKEMSNIRFVKVGVIKTGLLVIQKGDGPGCYTIGINETKKAKGCSAKIGGGSLAKFLADRDIKPGRYLLVHNKTKDRWEAEVLRP